MIIIFKAIHGYKCTINVKMKIPEFEKICEAKLYRINECSRSFMA
ncbi:MAG: hypothetical protein QXD79_07435 [Candidatus Methanomethylicia archaeon]